MEEEEEEEKRKRFGFGASARRFFFCEEEAPVGQLARVLKIVCFPLLPAIFVITGMGFTKYHNVKCSLDQALMCTVR